jgi:hypothetical protein
MKFQPICSIALALILFPLAAGAAVSEKPAPTTPDSVTILLPENTTAAAAAQTKETHSPEEIALFLSSWQPNRITVSSRVPNTSEFKTIGVPYFSVAYESRPLIEGKYGNLSAIAGLGFLAMDRTGIIAYETGNLGDSQHLYVLPASAGLQVAPRFLSWKMLKTYGRLLFVPALAAVDESTLGNQSFRLALNFEAIGGISYGLGWLWHNRDYTAGPKLHVGVTETFGGLTATDLSGFGIQSGIGFAF